MIVSEVLERDACQDATEEGREGVAQDVVHKQRHGLAGQGQGQRTHSYF